MRTVTSLGLVLFVVAAVAGLAVGMMAAPDVFRPALQSFTSWIKGEGEHGATVTGQLRLDGRPVPYARIELHNGGQHVAFTGADGSFSFTDVPSGEAQLTVSVNEVTPPAGADLEELATYSPPPIPDRYATVATSGLRLTLQPGSQHRLINLRH